MSYCMGVSVPKMTSSREPSGPEPIKLSEKEREEVGKRLNRKRQEKIKAGKRTYQPRK